MNTRFIALISEAKSFDIAFSPGLSLTQGTIFSTDLFSLHGTLFVKDPGSLLFRTVSTRRFNSLLRDAVEAAESGNFTPDEFRPVGEEIKNSKTPLPKLLVCCKLLEEIAVRSKDEKVWREAMNILATPLYGRGVPGPAGTALERICVCCLSAIHVRSSESSKRETCSQIMTGARKMEFFMEALCGSLFTSLNRKREQRGSIALAGIGEEPIVLAALMAHSLRSRALPALRPGLDASSPWLTAGAGLVPSELVPDQALEGVLDALVRSGAAIDPLEGKSIIMALARGDPYALVGNEVHRKVVLGFRHILSLKELPHPWFQKPGERDVFPIPTFDPKGIQVAAFLSLAAMPSPEALAAAVRGVTELVVPHIHSVGPQGVEIREPSVRGAMGLVNYTLLELLSRNPAIQPFQAEDAMGLLFAHPKHLPLDKFDGRALFGMSPLFCKIAMRSSNIGAEDSAVSRIASECLVRWLCSEPQAGTALESERRMETFMQIQRQMFGTGPHLPEPARTREFLQQIARKTAGRPLPPFGTGNKQTR